MNPVRRAQVEDAWFAVGIVAMAIIILGSLVWPLFVDTP